MTAQKTAEAGVALLPDLRARQSGGYPLPSSDLMPIIAALELLKPVADGTHEILPIEPADDTFLRLKGNKP